MSASFVRLSTSYFFRAFKGSFGVPPHAYVIQRRMARAQMMLSGADEPLGQIAIASARRSGAFLTALPARRRGSSGGLAPRAERRNAGWRPGAGRSRVTAPRSASRPWLHVVEMAHRVANEYTLEQEFCGSGSSILLTFPCSEG